jgi:hypothetical protein
MSSLYLFLTIKICSRVLEDAERLELVGSACAELYQQQWSQAMDDLLL